MERRNRIVWNLVSRVSFSVFKEIVDLKRNWCFLIFFLNQRCTFFYCRKVTVWMYGPLQMSTKHVALFQLPSHSNGKVMISPCSLPNFLIVNRLFWQFSIQGCVTKLEISGNSLVLSHYCACSRSAKETETFLRKSRGNLLWSFLLKDCPVSHASHGVEPIACAYIRIKYFSCKVTFLATWRWLILFVFFYVFLSSYKINYNNN